MTYRGHVHNGVIVLDEPADIAEGSVVCVELFEESQAWPLHPEIKRFTGILPSEINIRDEYAEGLMKKHA